MANKTFKAQAPFMDKSIVCVSNDIWDVELYKTPHGTFDVRFAREFNSSFGNVWEDGLFHFSVDGAGKPPLYVLDMATRMWRDNVA